MKCKACGGSGVNSKGGPCTPCQHNKALVQQADNTPVLLKGKEDNVREFHLEERPTDFKQVVGQREVCQQLIAMGKAKQVPHCLLFTGPAGCGKTTLARIVRRKLKCSDADFVEVNAANSRGIDMVRSIQERVGLAPIDGETRVWLVDEAHALTTDAQGAFLKLLEEPPDHVYFMLATTNPQKLHQTIHTRCTEIKVRALTEQEIIGLVQRVAKDRADVVLSDSVAGKIAEVANGSARKALVLLQQIMGIDGDDAKIDTLQKSDAKQAAIEIARAIMAKKPWSTVAAIIKACDEEPETIRWMILSYFTTVALGGGKPSDRAVAIIEEFRDNYFDTKKAGLVISCYRACTL